VQGRLYLVVTPRPGRSFAETLDRTERALAGGVEVLQLRAKDWEARPILELGERMRALAERYGVPFFLNDRPDLAALLQADGVHLGQNDLTPLEARRFFGGWWAAPPTRRSRP
jgi:thiamine-phosphate pyrophosphorylase